MITVQQIEGIAFLVATFGFIGMILWCLAFLPGYFMHLRWVDLGCTCEFWHRNETCPIHRCRRRY